MKKGDLSTASLESFFVKIEALTKVQRIMICCGAFLALAGLFAYFFYLPKSNRINQLTKEYEKVEKDLIKARRNAAELDKFKKEMETAEVEFRMALKALPEKEEIPSLLSAISRSGSDSGLEFLLFQPEGENRKDFYAEIPVSLQLAGGYHSLGLFFDKIARLPRIVNLKDIEIERSKEKTLVTSCKAVTYKFVEKELKKEAKGIAKKKWGKYSKKK